MDNKKKAELTVDMRAQLSTLWIVVMVEMIFADIFTIMVELVNRNTLSDMPGDVLTVMALAAVATNVPILMIWFARTLPRRSNRWANIVAAIFTIIYVVGMGIPTPHYIIVAGVEVIVLLAIIVKAWRWKEPK